MEPTLKQTLIRSEALEGPIEVKSIVGITKRVCLGGCDCDEDYCEDAHPNALGSKVLHPKWCLQGAVLDCNNMQCPFNHFKTFRQFKSYRDRADTVRPTNYNFGLSMPEYIVCIESDLDPALNPKAKTFYPGIGCL